MNRKLLTSVSLLAVLLSAPSFAEHTHILMRSKDWKVSFGGDLNLQSGARFQSKSKTRQGAVVSGPSSNNDHVAFNSTANAHLGAESKTKDGTTYGAQIGIYANSRGSMPSKDAWGRTYAFVENDNWGRFEAGTKKGASLTMQIDGEDAIGSAGTGGFNGDWDKYLSLTSLKGPAYDVNDKATNKDNFAGSTGLVIKDNKGSANNEGVRKITYYTPKYNGFQLGFSYLPDVANRGGDLEPFNDKGATPTRDMKNAMMVGITYEKEIDKKQKLEVALVGETGRLVRSAQDIDNGRVYTKNPFGFDLGAIYTYDNVTFAGSYGEAGKFKYIKASNPKKTTFYTAGLGYKVTEKITTGLTYMHSDNKNKLNIVSVGASYNWVAGVLAYAELTHVMAHQKFDYDYVAQDTAKKKDENSNTYFPTGVNSKPANSKTSGTVAIVGLRFNL